MLCSSSYIINVANKEEIRSYEWCPIGIQHGEVYNETDLLASTNHYINPDWDLAQPTDETSWNSLTRRVKTAPSKEWQEIDLNKYWTKQK